MLKWFKYGLTGVLLLQLAVVVGQQNLEEQRLKVMMRKVGHEFLLQMNDSTSRVLPIQKEGGRYRIEFEKSFDFEPDLLLFSAVNVFEANNLNSNYILEVEQCYTKQVVYSYEYEPEVEDAVVACKSRPLPTDCYVFYFTFVGEQVLDSVTPVEPQQPTKIWLVVLIGGLLVVVSAGIYLLKNKPKNGNAGLVRVGKYQFDRQRMKLILDQQIEELSSKEADLLALLVANAHQTVERDHILSVVWNDEGDYVGRTLDVSVSKLRKKLQADPGVKIINIRGVGYRLTIEE